MYKECVQHIQKQSITVLKFQGVVGFQVDLFKIASFFFDFKVEMKKRSICNFNYYNIPTRNNLQSIKLQYN